MSIVTINKLELVIALTIYTVIRIEEQLQSKNKGKTINPLSFLSGNQSHTNGFMIKKEQ